MANLTLNLSFNEVFDDFSEVFVGNSLRFEGCLKPCFEGVSNFSLIKFVSGGRRYLTYDLDRDGVFVRGWIRYRPAEFADPKNIDLSISKMEEAIGQAPNKRPKIKADDKVKKPKKPSKKRVADDELAKKMQDMYKAGATQVSLAKKFDINKKTVYLIVNKKGAYAE